ncbi:type II secretion system protein [Comamonas terrae]|uniref:Type II secretion system protein n=1 Tax=Comamonas terrae TaxID=673548 RepID=A0ABW5URN8_9BURK|nr:type II secretion system protein [Comamonas terrae]
MLRTRHHRKQQQAGFLMLELIAVLGLTAVLGVYASKEAIDKINSGRAEATGVYLSTLKDGLDKFLNLNAQALAMGSVVAGFSDPLAPTVDELRTAKYLAASFPLIDPMRRRQLITVDRSGCPGSTCSLTAYSYSHLPLTASCNGYATDGACAAAMGSIWHVQAEEIRSASQGYGATVTLLAPTRLRGSSCNYPTPGGAAPATYGVCTARTAAIYSQFVRIRDDRDPDLQGDLSVVGKVKSGSLVSQSLSISNGPTETASINSGGDLTVKNGSGVPTAGISMSDGSGRTYGQVIKPTSVQVKGSSCTGANQQGDIAQDSTSQGLVMCIGGTWKGISPQKDAIAGGWCPQNGGVAWNAQDIALYCSGNQWVPLADRFGKKIFIESYSASNGTWIPKPACVSGTAGSMVILTPKNQSTDAVKLNHYATDYGWAWLVSVVDNLGAAAAGEAIAQTYCIY